MNPRSLTLLYVHDGNPGAIGATLETHGAELTFAQEGSGLLGIPRDAVATAGSVAVRVELRAREALSPELRELVGDDVPCIVARSENEARVVVTRSALARANPTIADLRGKIRYGLARVGWEID